MDIFKQELRRLSVDDQNLEGMPAWSPDGRTIAFITWSDGCTCQIDLFNVLTGTRRRILGGSQLMEVPVSSPPQAVRSIRVEGGLEWSPDGKTILFAFGADGYLTDIFAIRTDGTGLRQLTAGPYYNVSPDFSPDGRYIAFVSHQLREQNIYRMNADGSNPIPLTDNNGINEYKPHWSPDGTRIAFTVFIDYKYQVQVIDADGEHTIQLTDSPFIVFDRYAWSPDGSQIFFFSRAPDVAELYVVNMDGSQMRRLVSYQGQMIGIDAAWLSAWTAEADS
jgi:Tol biopolymer transport system component